MKLVNIRQILFTGAISLNYSSDFTGGDFNISGDPILNIIIRKGYFYKLINPKYSFSLAKNFTYDNVSNIFKRQIPILTIGLSNAKTYNDLSNKYLTSPLSSINIDFQNELIQKSDTLITDYQKSTNKQLTWSNALVPPSDFIVPPIFPIYQDLLLFTIDAKSMLQYYYNVASFASESYQVSETVQSIAINPLQYDSIMIAISNKFLFGQNWYTNSPWRMTQLINFSFTATLEEYQNVNS